jgi:hypothetical protein
LRDQPALGSLWLGVLACTLFACSGRDRPAGVIEGKARPDSVQRGEAGVQEAASRNLATRAGPRVLGEKRILFGDLHVHTTYSTDAFFMSLPVMAGEGAHPPADACDFARYCSQLDFFALTDHAEGLTPEHWASEKESIRQCNAMAGDPADPDLVAFTGFEWTQVGRTPETHFGHKCVFFRDDAESAVPARPITAQANDGADLFAGLDLARSLRWFDPLGYRDYADFLWMIDRVSRLPRCASGTDTRTLPTDCQENAATPDVLFEKLRQWGYPVMVIPHGTSWGFYTPPGTTMDKQLTHKYHDPALQPLIEVMSGHGNSEQYRWWREYDEGPDGKKICPEPTADYLPCCWQAGEIMRKRCGDLPAAECEARVEEAKRLALDASVSPQLVFPDTRAEDWLDCGQCRDCFKPTFSLRPQESVQYTMAISNFDEKDERGEPLRFHYGFVASSDNHKARPGTGYKQYDRRQMTEAVGVRSTFYDDLGRRRRLKLQTDPRKPMVVGELGGLLSADVERVASYLYPGGLVAVHSAGRSRQAIWEALERREVYGTSGPRILLWFDLLNGPEGPAPMGSTVTLAGAPRFEVRAIGSAVEQPGCPETTIRGLPPERVERLCRGECHHPSDRRHPIVAIEIVRIRPQATPGEDVNRLIEDPWLRFECGADPSGCTVQFEDLEFPRLRRHTLYYARAIEEETPAINGANLRTQFDSSGRAVATKPCYGDYRTPFSDDCLSPVQERAWSSPIFVDPGDGKPLTDRSGP